MIVISDDFKNSVSATEREMKGYVEITYTNSEAKENASITNYPDILQINGTSISPNGIIDDDRKGKNYASLEQDYFRLDGTFVLPNNDATKNPGMGYVTENIFEDDNYIPVTPFSISTNTTEEINGLTMYFQNNKPLDIEVQITSGTDVETFNNIDISDTGVATLTFSDRIISFLRIYVKDVLYLNRRIRLQEVDFGLSSIYEGEDLISFKIIEQCDRFADEMPINECEVVLGDYKGKFDVNNPNGMTRYLGENVLIKPFVGVVTENNGIEYCTMGTYWLEEWKSDKGSATLTAKDIFIKMDKANYWLTTDNYVDYDAYLTTKAQDWNIPINNYMNLSDYIITKYSDNSTARTWAKVYAPDTYLDNLQKYCVVFGGTIIPTRDGELNYISSKEKTSSIILDKSLLKEYPEIKEKNKIKDINVSEYRMVGGSSTSYATTFTRTFELSGINEIKIPLETCQWVHIKFSTTPTIIQSNIPTTSGEYALAGWSSQVYLKVNYTGSLTVTVDVPQDITQYNEFINTYNLNETGNIIDIKNNYLTGLLSYLQRLPEHSQAIINYRITNMSNKELSFKFNGNPAIECGDCIEVEKKYTESSQYNKVWVTKIESEFKGSFNQTIEGDILEN